MSEAGNSRDGHVAAPEVVLMVHPYIARDPFAAISETLALIKADHENWQAEVARLSAEVYRLQGPM